MTPVEQSTGPDLPEGPYELSEALVLAAGLVPAGRAMSMAPDGTAWWRIVRADGTLPASLSSRAEPHYRTEGTPLKETTGPDDGASVRVDLVAALWEPDAAARDALARLRAGLGS